MKTKDYIKKFRMDEENFEFDRNEFLKELNKEFLDRLELTQKYRELSKMDFPFKVFQEIVKEMQSKFWAISNKKVGKPLTPELFSAFYAYAVIPAREKYFPNEHAEILKRREEIKKKQEEKERKAKETAEKEMAYDYELVMGPEN